MRRRLIAAILTLTVAAALGACVNNSSNETFSVVDPVTGVQVVGPASAVDGQVTTAEATDPPVMAEQFDRVGPVTNLEGKLLDDVTVTVPVPETYDGSLDELWILKGDGESWLPLLPQEIDNENRTLSITTRSFSFWTLGTWQAEEAAAQMAANLRNLTSTDGVWVVSDAAKFTGNAPVTECRYPALTLKLDTSQFIDQAILCPKFVTEGKDAEGRTTYDLYISNMQTYPVKLWLNKGVTFKKVTPSPNNPVTQLMNTAAHANQIVTMPGASELVLTVKADEIPEGGIKISGGLDFTTLMLDLTFASVEATTGFDMGGEFIKELGSTTAFIAYATCVAEGSQTLAEYFEQHSDVGFAEFGGMIFQEALNCMKGDLLTELLKDYYRNHGIFMSDEELAKWLAKMPTRIVTVLQHAPVLVSLASTIATVKYGRTTYLLNITPNDPAHNELYLALPEVGAGGFMSYPGFEPANMEPSYLFDDTTCLAPTTGEWSTWTESYAQGGYLRKDGEIWVWVELVYVGDPYNDAVQQLLETEDDCSLYYGGRLQAQDGPNYGDYTDYRSGYVGSGGFPTAIATLYDPNKGIVLHIQGTGDPDKADYTPEEVLAVVLEATDYAANKVSVRLGASFTLE